MSKLNSPDIEKSCRKLKPIGKKRNASEPSRETKQTKGWRKSEVTTKTKHKRIPQTIKQ